MNGRTQLKSLLSYLTLRQCGFDSHSRNLKTCVRNLITSSDSCMRHCWSKETSRDIKYNDHLFFNDFTEVRDYTGKLLYKLQPPKHGDKIIEIVRCELSIASHSSKGKIFALTKKNYLRIYDIHTGQLLSDFHLGSISYKHLCWESYLETIALKSTTAPVPQMIVFEAEPLRLKYKFSVPGNIFGPNLRAAYVLNGMLYVLRGKDELLCFHLVNLLQNNEVSGYRERVSRQSFSESLSGSVTHHFETAERIPPPLLHLRSKEHFLDFGGFPLTCVTWLADHSHALRPIEFADQLKLLATVRPPQQTLYVDELPSIVWHDNQWRLLVHNAESIAVYSLKKSKEMLTSSRRLTCDFVIFARDPRQVILNPTSDNGIAEDESIRKEKKKAEVVSSKVSEETVSAIENTDDKKEPPKTPVTVSSVASDSITMSTKFVSQSGRETTLRFGAFEALSSASHFHSVTYEDELDILTVTIGGEVHLYDNTTGKLLRSIHLKHWNEKFENQVILDKVTLYHLVSAPGKKCAAHLYEWTRNEDMKQVQNASMDEGGGNAVGPVARRRRRRRGSGVDSDGEQEDDDDGEYVNVSTARRRR